MVSFLMVSITNGLERRLLATVQWTVATAVAQGELPLAAREGGLGHFRRKASPLVFGGHIFVVSFLMVSITNGLER